MEKIKQFLVALRAPFFTASIVPVILGVSVAYYEREKINGILFGITLLGAVFIHAGVNLLNDYFDTISGNDLINKTPTPFSGGSGVILKGWFSKGQILFFSLLFFGMGAAIGLYLNFISKGNVILLIGIIGVFLGFFYSAGPLKISYFGHGLGEIAVGIGFGPLIVLGSYYIQTQQISWVSVAVSFPLSILISLVVFINEFPDYEADKEVGKKTLIVVLGRKNAREIYYLLLLMCYLQIAFFIAVNIFPLWCGISALTLPVAVKVVKNLRLNYDKIAELALSQGGTIILHITVGLLLSLGFVLARVV